MRKENLARKMAAMLVEIDRELEKYPVCLKLYDLFVREKPQPGGSANMNRGLSHNGNERPGLGSLNRIMEVLTNPNMNMLGIYGSNSKSKAELVEKIRRRVKRDNLFDVIVEASVTKKPDLKRIQEELGNKLNLQFEDNTESRRAKCLYDRIKKEKRILVILDDLRGKIDLDKLGISFGNDHEGCKILLICETAEVFLHFHMNTQQYFPES